MEPLTHIAASKDPEWNESYYFIFYDKKNKIGGMSRLGFKPNKKEGMTFLFLFLPDGSIGAYHATDDAHNYPDNLFVENVQLRYQGEGIWRYTYEGPMLIFKNPEDFAKVQENPEVITDLVGARIDLEYKALNDTYEYSEHMTAESIEIGKKSGDMHWEQIGVVKGTVSVGNQIFDIDRCISQRDHTHGIRDWTGVGNWFYFVIWFNETLALNPAAIILDDGRIGSGGFIYKDGENIPIQTISLVEHRYREDGIMPISTELEITDNKGDIHILKAVPGRIVPVPFKGADGSISYLIQSFGSFTYDDVEGGYGSYEVLRRVSSK